MKFKVLIVPLLLVVVIVFIIWMVAPAFGEVREKNHSLKREREKLVDIQEKSRKIEQLSQELGKSNEEQNILLEYLPSSGKEEEIIDNLNYIALNSGLLVSNISVAEAKNNLASVSVGESENSLSGGIKSGAEQIGGIGTETPALKNIEINFETAGSYENIKAAIEKMSKLERFNDISLFKISKMVNPTGGESASNNNLEVKMKLTFNFLEKINSLVNVDNKIFSEGKFDVSVIEEIKNKTGLDVLKMNLDSIGKTNPFNP